MQLQELKQMVWETIDDAPADLTVIRWFDRAQDRLASSVGAKFPRFIANGTFDPNTEPVWDEKWHEALVVFACARYKEAESSLNEVQNFQQQFDTLMSEMSENYQIPIQYRDDRLVQQFIAVSNQVSFVISKLGFDPVYGNLQVFVNGVETTDFTLDADTKMFTINATTVVNADDKITALWQEYYDYDQPPVPWLNSF